MFLLNEKRRRNKIPMITRITLKKSLKKTISWLSVWSEVRLAFSSKIMATKSITRKHSQINTIISVPAATESIISLKVM